MPLSYPALWPLFANDIEIVSTPSAADLYLFAHRMDIEHAPRDMVEDWRRRRRPVVLLSEEPFWDTIWGKQPLDHMIFVDTGFGALPVIQLNHVTTQIFRFERIPYYLLTNPRFARAYQRMFARNATRTAKDWTRNWARRRLDLAFMFERRPEPVHDVSWPSAELFGLCAWRTRVADACQGKRIAHMGRSWQGGPSRFELRNWHMDKLRRLDGRARIIGALENTHHPDYITEKFFDAFACGAVPIYAASKTHRIHEFNLPQESWMNLKDASPDTAANNIHKYTEAPEAFATAQLRLATLFLATYLWDAERLKLRDRVLAALQNIM